MYIELEEDTLAVRDLARDFGKSDVAPAAAGWDAAAQLPGAPVAALGALGVLGLAVPEAAGGTGLGALELAVVSEELGARSGVLAHHVAALAGQLALFAAVVPDSPALAAALAGTLRLGGAFPGAGPLALDRQGRASGALDPVRGASQADRLLATAIDPEGALVLVLVDPAAPGVTRVGRPGELGLRGVDLGAVRLADAGVEVLGPLPQVAAARALAETRLALAGVALGLGRAALEEGARYAAARTQFGRPIADFQAISFKIADSATELDAARLLLHATAGELAPGSDAAVGNDGLDGPGAAGLALLLALRAASRATDEALQIHGGYGYTRDFPVERLWRDVRALAALEGPVDALALEAAAALHQGTR